MARMRKGGKYKVGDCWFMKGAFKNLKGNEKVEIVKVYKKRRRTFVDVQDINGTIVTGVSSIMLRKRPR